ncbi:dephospho-CoA kinase [Acetobacter sp. TBRC 12305]|uniref:Dephospho-CoA kinase n=1 Tax=Acetobacter garciniae TaxID=2817435 RepID=A0A939HJE5_9PROT|nr:dephospho-CoA kinase [Acetobacter garciniae]MBO1323835.1 dephospho-CoA kinase [Acetobacter garciniae]MBX0343524.1 dephospho-CoA kinase [Acetobacter garciniae]
MKILGLTGGMGMGKSTVAAMLERAGMPVFDADAQVRRLQSEPGPVLSAMARLVPDAMIGGKLDRAALRRAVMARPQLLARLEAIIHPQVRAARARFLARHRRRGTRWVVLDIPLLFETGGDRLCDHVLVVSAPRWVQARRVAARRGMTPAEARKLMARQMPDARRRLRADTILRTGRALGDTKRQVRQFVRKRFARRQA